MPRARGVSGSRFATRTLAADENPRHDYLAAGAFAVRAAHTQRQHLSIRISR
jgi:hypothetical protein